jgi:penicillin-binding protein 2
VYTKEPEPGDNVYLTIDIGLQEAAEQALNSFITQANAAREENNKTAVLTGKNPQELISGGAVAAVSVKTGEPLCLASYPTYDLSTFLEDYSELLEDPNAPLFNRALMGTYAPGSTFKPCTAVAIMNEGIITPATTLTDEGIFTKYKEQNYAPKCWIYPGNHGTINVAQAITVSCNYFFYHFGDLLGVDKLSHYAAGFGSARKRASSCRKPGANVHPGL